MRYRTDRFPCMDYAFCSVGSAIRQFFYWRFNMNLVALKTKYALALLAAGILAAGPVMADNLPHFWRKQP